MEADDSVEQKFGLPRAGARPRARLRLIATTDLHAQILPWDYYADRPAPPGGLAVLAPLVRRLRAAQPNSLLLDNGDFLQGNPLADWAATEGRDEPHPVVAAMNALGYDAGTLGNHEFNYGLDVLDKVLAEAAFPLVSANIRRAGGADPALVPPHVLLERTVVDDTGRHWPLRIGIIGFAPPQISLWEKMHLSGRIATDDIIAAARRHVPALRAQGADVVVALCHSGIGAVEHSDRMENAALPLSRVEGIDAIVVGHTHGVFPADRAPAGGGVEPLAGTLNGKPAVMAGAMGSHLGVIDLLLDRTDTGWRPVGHAVSALPASGQAAGAGPPGADDDAAPDPALVARAQPVHDRVLNLIRQPIGRSDIPLDSHFALVRMDAALQAVADAQRVHAAERLAGTDWAGLPMLSTVAPFRAGGRGGPGGFVDIPAGELSLRHAAELYIYPNTLCAIEATGAVIADWLERAAGLFLTLTPGQTDQPLIDPAFPCYNFDVIAGLDYVIDPSRPGGTPDPASRRVREIRWQGRPVAPDDRFVVVTNSYRAGGGGGFDAVAGAPVVLAEGRAVRDVVIAHLRRHRPNPPQPVWRFAPLPGTTAWFETAPAASAARAGGLRLDDLGLAGNGFRRFRLHL